MKMVNRVENTQNTVLDTEFRIIFTIKKIYKEIEEKIQKMVFPFLQRVLYKTSAVFNRENRFLARQT